MAVDIRTPAQKWNFHKQMAFAYLTCERLYPNYVFFHQNYHFGDPVFLRSSIDYFRETVLSKDINTSRAQEILDLLLEYVPSPEDFPTVLATSAMDACTAIEASCHFILNKDAEMLFYISTMATDSVDMYIQERDDLDYSTTPDFEARIKADALMVRELKVQHDIITYLNSTDQLSEAALTELLQLQNNDGKGNLNL